MKGDFSRIRFNPRKHYTSVLQQQGRVALDADGNEQCSIIEYIRETETTDIVGPVGGPIGDEGFAITISGNTIQIGAGRYYVDGILCENEGLLDYAQQPFLLDPSPTDAELLADLNSGSITSIQVYLEVSKRLVTSRDDICLREPALGQADTTVRVQTVWRVLARAGSAVKPVNRFTSAAGARLAADAAAAAVLLPKPTTNCCDMTWPLPPTPIGTMGAQTGGGSGDCSCQPVPAAGYLGIENQLYRVEIQESGDETSATFKCSRENGSVVVGITGVSGKAVYVDSLGPDANLGFASGQWVEISDDTDQFGQTPGPGTLYQIDKVIPERLTLQMTETVAQVDTSRNPRARRWDQFGASAVSAGVPLAANTWLPLENGIQIRFTPGNYLTGDYWLIPARAASGEIDWPPCGDGPLQRPPIRPRVLRAPLACITWDTAAKQITVKDCRTVFYPLTELTPPAVPTALHVTAINWPQDDVTTFDWLLKNGLQVTLDGTAPSLQYLSAASFSVTFEVALPILSTSERLAIAGSALVPQALKDSVAAATALIPNSVKVAASTTSVFTAVAKGSNLNIAKQFVNFQQREVAVFRVEVLLDGEFSTAGSTITWTPFASYTNQVLAVTLLDLLLFIGATEEAFSRVRVKLAGRALFSGAGANQIYLDGQAFGTPGVRADQVTANVALQLPSGNSAKASDFESWFYLAPTLSVLSLTIDHPTVQFNVNGTVTDAGTATPAVSPMATITLNYAAPANTTVTVTINGPDSSGVIAPFSPVTIKSGSKTGQFPVTVIGNTGAVTPQVYSLVAQITDISGATKSQSANFSVKGYIRKFPGPRLTTRAKIAKAPTENNG